MEGYFLPEKINNNKIIDRITLEILKEIRNKIPVNPDLLELMQDKIKKKLQEFEKEIEHQIRQRNLNSKIEKIMAYMVERHYEPFIYEEVQMKIRTILLEE